MSGLQAVIFDFDGVILESVDVKGWAFGRLFEGFPEHTEKILYYHHAHGGVSRHVKFRYIYENILKQTLSDEKFGELCEQYSQLVFDKVVGSPFVPGALEFLQKYSERIPLFIVSGTPQEEMRRVIYAKDLDRHFKGIYGSPRSKSYWTQNIVCDNDFDTDSVIFVGDAMSDWEAANENNIGFIARIAEGKEDILGEKKVEFRVRDLLELGNYIENRGTKYVCRK